MHNPRHFTYTQEALDKVAEIVCKEKQKEIEDFKEYLKSLGEEAMELANKYQFNPDEEYDMPHDLWDFLNAI